MLPSLKNAMPLASIHCIYTLSHEWNPVEMLSWFVSCFSAFSASIFTWSNFSVSSLLADCSSRWSTRILFSFTCMAWQNWNMTLELSEKWGKQQNKWRSWSSLPWKIHTCRAPTKNGDSAGSGETATWILSIERGGLIQTWDYHQQIWCFWQTTHAGPQLVGAWKKIYLE